MALAARPATPADAERIAQIYNEGIEDRVGTFETTPRSAADVRAWFDGRHPIVVVEDDAVDRPAGDRAASIVAFASTSSYRARECYAGIAEFSVYVARSGRGKGAGRVAMRALIDAVKPAGIWKLVSRIFIENTASRRLMAAMGFREVGIYEKHARLDGQWRDVVIVERLIPENLS
jgi:phosphinothricin acetyltransferase